MIYTIEGSDSMTDGHEKDHGLLSTKDELDGQCLEETGGGVVTVSDVCGHGIEEGEGDRATIPRNRNELISNKPLQLNRERERNQILRGKNQEKPLLNSRNLTTHQNLVVVSDNRDCKCVTWFSVYVYRGICG